MLKKEIFIKNLSKIAPGMKQKEIASIMDCQPATVSKYLNPERKDFPTAEMLYNLSLHFNVSIDWLLGIKNESSKDKLTVRQACKSIVDIAHTFGLEYSSIKIHEICYYYDDSYPQQICRGEEDNQYTAMYFSNWFKSENSEAMLDFEMDGNYASQKAMINDFLEKFIRIEKMREDGALPNDMYDALLNTYLDEVKGFNE